MDLNTNGDGHRNVTLNVLDESWFGVRMLRVEGTGIAVWTQDDLEKAQRSRHVQSVCHYDRYVTVPALTSMSVNDLELTSVLTKN